MERVLSGFRPTRHRTRRGPAVALLALLIFARTPGTNAQAPAAADPAALLDTIPDAGRRKVFAAVWTTIRDLHFGPQTVGVDWNVALARHAPDAAAAQDDEALYAAINAMLAELGQSHCQAIPSGSAKRKREPRAGDSGADPAPPGSEGPLGEPGIEIRAVDGHAVIVAVAADGPAALAGLRPGAIVRAVDGAALPPPPGTGARLSEATEWTFHCLAALLGSVAHPVKLTLLDAPGAEERTVEVPRAPTPLAAFGHLVMPASFSSRRLDGGFAYIRMGSFVMPVFQQFQKALREHRDAPGLVLDLRGNPGGIGTIAPGMMGFLCRERLDIGTSRMKEGELRFPVFPRKEAFLAPVAVLIDEASASTSEILAAGLRDAGRARLFGRNTAGMVLPSYVHELPDGGRLQFPMADFVTAKGISLEARGVAPDEAVDWTMADCRAGRDPMLDAAVRWLADPKVK